VLCQTSCDIVISLLRIGFINRLRICRDIFDGAAYAFKNPANNIGHHNLARPVMGGDSNGFARVFRQCLTCNCGQYYRESPCNHFTSKFYHFCSPCFSGISAASIISICFFCSFTSARPRGDPCSTSDTLSLPRLRNHGLKLMARFVFALVMLVLCHSTRLNRIKP